MQVRRLRAVDSLRAASCGREQPVLARLAGRCGCRDAPALWAGFAGGLSRIKGPQLVRQRHPALECGRQGERDALRETWLKPGGHPAGSSQERCRGITASGRWTCRKRRVDRRPRLRQAARQAVDRRHHLARAEPARRQPRQGAQTRANAVAAPSPDTPDRDRSGDGSRTGPDGPRGRAPRRVEQHEIRLKDHLRGLSQHPCSQTLHTGCTSPASYAHASQCTLRVGIPARVSRSREKGAR